MNCNFYYCDKNNLKLFKVAIILIWLLSHHNVLLSSGATVNENGGYDLIIAINDEPSDLDNVTTTQYIDNVQNSFQLLSDHLWSATDKVFWINSIQLVIPSTWNHENVTRTTVNSWKTADIRISNEIQYPNAQNPNVCGSPGDFIELPCSFFTKLTTPKYGENWKALLVLWTHFRWGAWEEHGHPGDEIFPYFHKRDHVRAEENKPYWKVTGCTNAPNNELVGKFEHIIDGNETTCDPRESTEMDINCRFIPDATEQDVTTSLMHFHWVQPVIRFCDDTTHQQKVPNKQNLFCDYKSVMSTIQSSRDFKAVVNKTYFVSPPQVNFEVLKLSNRRLLYVLIDVGNIEEDTKEIFHVARHEIEKVFSETNLPDVMAEGVHAGVGLFPKNENETDKYSPTTPIQSIQEGATREIFLGAIQNASLTEVKNRNFGTALLQAADTIESVGSTVGGVILLLKTSGPNNSSNFPFEKEVEIYLRQRDIVLYAIEIPDGSNAGHNLENLTKGLNGNSTTLTTTTVAAAGSDVYQFMKVFMKKYLYEMPPKIDSPTPKISLRGEVRSDASYPITPMHDTDILNFYFITSERLNELTGGIDNFDTSYLADFQVIPEYGVKDTGAKRFLHSGSLKLGIPGMTFRQLSFEFHSPQNMSGFLIITSEGPHVAADISVTVTTSAIHDVIDLSHRLNANEPLTIFAQITQSGSPITGATVHAELKSVQGSEEIVMNFPLHDDGLGSVDIAANDGIYTEIIAPPTDGNYTLSVIVDKAEIELIVAHRFVQGSVLRLLPTDQQDLGPKEELVEYPAGLAPKMVDYDGVLQVKNTKDFSPFITKIRSLTISSMTEGAPNSLIFTYNVPTIVQLGMKEGSPDRYGFYVASKFQDLVNLDLDKELPSGVENAFNHTDPSMIDAKPGDILQVTYEYPQVLFSYFAVVAYNTSSGIRSGISNIVSIKNPESLETTTSSSTTLGTTEAYSETTVTEINDYFTTTTGGDDIISTSTTPPMSISMSTTTTTPSTTTTNTTTPVPITLVSAAETSSITTSKEITDSTWSEKAVGIATTTGSILIIIGALAVYFLMKTPQTSGAYNVTEL